MRSNKFSAFIAGSVSLVIGFAITWGLGAAFLCAGLLLLGVSMLWYLEGNEKF